MVHRIYYPDLLYKLVATLAPSQTWRVDLRGGLPGWMVQQIIKLNCMHWVGDGALVLVDSDVIFTRPFTLADLGLDGADRTLVRITPLSESSRHRRTLQRSRRLLGLPDGPTEHHYMSSPTVWYTDWADKLKAHLQQVSGMNWQRALFLAQEFSEYTLYGLFVEEVLKPDGLQVRTRPLHRIVHDLTSFRQLQNVNERHRIAWNVPNSFTASGSPIWRTIDLTPGPIVLCPSGSPLSFVYPQCASSQSENTPFASP